jgi:hypothetical protein
MRPRSTTSDLPSTHDVKVYLHNEFVKHMKDLKDEIKAAPGKVSITADGWSTDNTKMGFMGMTAHWIQVKDGKWKMRAAVIRFKALSGTHSGENLGRYAVGLLDRIGIMDKSGSKASHFRLPHGKNHVIYSHVTNSKLYTATLDNTRNNNTTCRTIEDVHVCRGLEWNSYEQQLPYVIPLSHVSRADDSYSCLGHAVNLGNVDVMAHITKIAAVENATAIWEYDPTRDDNRVLGGSLDVIAAIRTLAIKVSIVLNLQRSHFMLQVL